MRRKSTLTVTRPFTMARREPQTRPEAAAELVRLEYERDRIERDLEMITQRQAAAKQRLAQVEKRAVHLQSLLFSPQKKG